VAISEGKIHKKGAAGNENLATPCVYWRAL